MHVTSLGIFDLGIVSRAESQALTSQMRPCFLGLSRQLFGPLRLTVVFDSSSLLPTDAELLRLHPQPYILEAVTCLPNKDTFAGKHHLKQRPLKQLQCCCPAYNRFDRKGRRTSNRCCWLSCSHRFLVTARNQTSKVPILRILVIT